MCHLFTRNALWWCSIVLCWAFWTKTHFRIVLSLWQVDFGEVFIPVGLDVPKPRVLPEFKRLAHGLRSSNISVLDAKTFYIPNLHYDGAGPDAYFWVGNGSEPNIMGIKVISVYNIYIYSYSKINWIFPWKHYKWNYSTDSYTGN